MNRPLVEPVGIAPLVICAPVAHPVEGHPIGNGRMGTLVWTTPSTVELQINRVDVFAVNRHTSAARMPGPTDYGGGCARVSIAVGGEPFGAGAHFAQRLSLADARCEISGEAVRYLILPYACKDLTTAYQTHQYTPNLKNKFRSPALDSGPAR